MVAVSDFTSVFEVSIALHLAYSLIDNLHTLPISTFWKSLNAFSKWTDEMVARGVLTAADKKEVDRKLLWIGLGLWLDAEQFAKRVKYFVLAAILISVYSLSWLLFVGFYPAAELSLLGISFVLAIALLPMPVIMLITYLVMRRKLQPLRKDFTETFNEVQTISKASRDWENS